MRTAQLRNTQSDKQRECRGFHMLKNIFYEKKRTLVKGNVFETSLFEIHYRNKIRYVHISYTIV
jgi:hypothetical protein